MTVREAIGSAGIAALRERLESGYVSSVGLVAGFLNRIATFDRSGPALNAVPVLDPSAFEQARAADLRRSAGVTRGALDGIPFTVKDSFAVKGLTVAAGSPAFAELIAPADAASVALLRSAGAVVLGKTTMPPMAAGGMQCGVYGRAESPYNAGYLPAAWVSGSSNGAGVATASGFAAFGLAEETVSSGRSPASNNGVVAYTPSRGQISIRGNWPLFAIRDVVVPYARTLDDLFEVLDVVVADDPETRGDFWREQSILPVPRPSSWRPARFDELRDARALHGARVGVPRIFIGDADEAAAGPTAPVVVRDSIHALWLEAAADLARLGAEIVPVDFPLLENYECGPEDSARWPAERGPHPSDFKRRERLELVAAGWSEYLAAIGQPGLASLDDCDPLSIFPDRLAGLQPDGIPAIRLPYEQIVRSGHPDWRATQMPGLREHLEGLERARREDLDDWMRANELDVVAFPANADVARADSATDLEAAVQARANGCGRSNGNDAVRHYGLPTVTVPMGVMADIGMPVGLTFLGRPFEDAEVLRYAYSYEAGTRHAVAPPRTPPIPAESVGSGVPAVGTNLAVTIAEHPAGDASGALSGRVRGAAAEAALAVYVGGSAVPVRREGDRWTSPATVDPEALVVAVVSCPRAGEAGAFRSPPVPTYR